MTRQGVLAADGLVSRRRAYRIAPAIPGNIAKSIIFLGKLHGHHCH
jgi:hypothetical protein